MGSKHDDPDGVDAFLCLVTAIAFDIGDAEGLRGDATDDQIEQEGQIIAPKAFF